MPSDRNIFRKILEEHYWSANPSRTDLSCAALPIAIDKESKSNHLEQSIKSSSKRITKYTADGKPIVNQSEWINEFKVEQLKTLTDQ
jgi:hypothetical protein